MFNDQHKQFRFDVAHRAVNDAVRPAVHLCGGVSDDDALDDLVRTFATNAAWLPRRCMAYGVP